MSQGQACQRCEDARWRAELYELVGVRSGVRRRQWLCQACAQWWAATRRVRAVPVVVQLVERVFLGRVARAAGAPALYGRAPARAPVESA